MFHTYNETKWIQAKMTSVDKTPRKIRLWP